MQIGYIDTHTAGEPTRVVISGIPDLGSGPMARRCEVWKKSHDSLRSGIVREPRGHEAMVGALLLESSLPDCQAGVIFFNNVGTLGMCGHGAMGVVEALRHLGRIDSGHCKLETPAGVVDLYLEDDGEISVQNVVSYRTAADCTVTLSGGQEVVGDIAWGGNWFFIARSPGIAVTLGNLAELTAIASDIREQLVDRGITGAAGEEIDHIDLHEELPAGEGTGVRSFVLCPGKQWDRSPCGTGTSATIACQHARNSLAEGDRWTQVGILGTRFTGTFRQVEGGIAPTIRGRAHLCGEGILHFQEEDPFRHGIDL